MFKDFVITHFMHGMGGAPEIMDDDDAPDSYMFLMIVYFLLVIVIQSAVIQGGYPI